MPNTTSRTVYLSHEDDRVLREAAWHQSLKMSSVLSACIRSGLLRWADDPTAMAGELHRELLDTSSISIPTAQPTDEMSNWRGRRLLAYKAIDDLISIVDKLDQNGDFPLPSQSKPHPITPEMKAELKNTLTNLLRTIMLFNDGSVSPASLPRF